MRFNRLVAVATATVLAGTACSSDDGADNESSEPESATAFDGSYEATITRTQGGVPHIVGENIESAVFGQGWANAEDHLCTLSDQILKVTSRRAEFYGPGADDENIDSDFAWRAIGIEERAKADWPDQPERDRGVIEAYAAGWNAQLDEIGADGVTGWCAGEPWVQPITAEELYTYARSISLTASSVQLDDFLGIAEPPSDEQASSDEASGTRATNANFNVAGANSSVGSNGWSLGGERTESGGGMLLANPHFPWEGSLRFWEVHLEVPGEINIYGAMLIGLPAAGVGFNEHIAWTHTVSAGNRFTAYELTLDPNDATAYMFDGESRPLESEESTIEVLADDGGTEQVSRTLWSSHHGPILEFPGIGWDSERTAAVRDANIDNDEFVGQYFDMNLATSMDELQEAHEENQGVPLFNTVATSSDGRSWYADTSATPNLSADALEEYEKSLAEGGLTKLAADSGAVLLDGSTSRDDWIEVDGARDPGLVPYGEMPQQERTDYLFNANDSFWLANTTELLSGDYSPLHGRQETERSMRTRENATLLADTSDSSLAGNGGLFNLDELTDAAFNNLAHSARILRAEVVERCTGNDIVEIGELVDQDDGSVVLPADSVDISASCAVLAGWDGVYDLGSVGPIVWRETWNVLSDTVEWSNDFDAADPVNTPIGLAPAQPDNPDPVLDALARATQIVSKAGFAVDTPLGEVQRDGRGSGIGLHGGFGSEGITNALGYSSSLGAPGEELPKRPERIAPDSNLTTDGYWINFGTSFIMAVDYTPDGPVARSLVTYGETSDRDDPLYTEQTEMFAAKDWKEVAYSRDAIERMAIGAPYTVAG